MSLRVRRWELQGIMLPSRMPFRYGIASLTRVLHVVLRLQVEVDGQPSLGVAADSLPPKWFVKDPDTDYDQELRSMIDVIQRAGVSATEISHRDSAFDWWLELYRRMALWGDQSGCPPLLWGLGLSLVERAVIDACCDQWGAGFSNALRENRFGIRLDAMSAELAGRAVGDLLPPTDSEEIVVRHTVGMEDPLTDDDLTDADVPEDGLPRSLTDSIREYGLTHFKIKLCGDAEADAGRLCRIADVLDAEAGDYKVTVDGNEQFVEMSQFRSAWSAFANEPRLDGFLRRVLFAEQPVTRHAALSGRTRTELLDWTDRPPIIIDESDDCLGVLEAALESGYAGTSHKNCKSVFRGVANACLLAARCGQGGVGILSGEDLVNVGPVALLQDLAVHAALGVAHVERNGHHYFRGLADWPPAVQTCVLEHHGDLYHRHPGGFPAVAIRGGRISTASVRAAPFGARCRPDRNALPISIAQFGTQG